MSKRSLIVLFAMGVTALVWIEANACRLVGGRCGVNIPKGAICNFATDNGGGPFSCEIFGTEGANCNSRLDNRCDLQVVATCSEPVVDSEALTTSRSNGNGDDDDDDDGGDSCPPSGDCHKVVTLKDAYFLGFSDAPTCLPTAPDGSVLCLHVALPKLMTPSPFDVSTSVCTGGRELKDVTPIKFNGRLCEVGSDCTNGRFTTTAAEIIRRLRVGGFPDYTFTREGNFTCTVGLNCPSPPFPPGS